MPTIQQLEQRLGRVKKQLTTAGPSGAGEAASFRQLRKTCRRLQRKLRAKRGVTTAKVAKPAAPPADAPAPPAEA